MDDADFRTALAEVRRFVRTEVLPRETEIDERDEIPATLRRQAADMGLFGFALPVEYGGLGLTMAQEAELVGELSYAAPAFRSMLGTNNGLAGQILVMAGTAAQQERWLPGIAAGEIIASFGLTEPEAGSDPSSLRTTARREGEEYVLDGTKRWITNAPAAHVVMTFARVLDGDTEQGISVFAVPTDVAGVTVGPKDHKMGQAGSLTAEVHYDGARVPADARIGGDEGYRIAMRSVARGRLSVASICVGMMRRLLDESVSFAAGREQGGARIADHQLIQALLAESATELYAAEAMLTRAAAAFDAGTIGRTEPSMVKYFASEAVGRVADRAVQIHGGMGYMRGVAVERLYRDARLFRIYEGTSQIQQLIIGRGVVRDAEPR
ncbi:acyl-CoA dehydrogenase [Jatrophihabitans endophyticus]|uniref:Acyl-CoA dehydrogenase n=1 Tax=Jatrophihabitans endophyticus TaxID=1206085 RepID=A0A1M5TBU4_9ACTN|nr:acyl-CoA dehydrogenase family protein [Jatrophihabitans endophyticus]SHH48156.1 acyl-CoA dehydrogenase [Jatrophihabitans endophyticus]